MKLVRKFNLILLIPAILFISSSCTDQVPKDEPLDIVFNSMAPHSIRGMEKVHVHPDRRVDVVQRGMRRSGRIPAAQYNRLVRSIRRMNFFSGIQELIGLGDSKKKTFTLEVKAFSPSHKFYWTGNGSSAFQPVLKEFKSIHNELGRRTRR